MLTEFERARLSIAMQIVAFLCVFLGFAAGLYLYVCGGLVETLTWDRTAKDYPPEMLTIASGLRWAGVAFAGAGCALGFAFRVVRKITLSNITGV